MREARGEHASSFTKWTTTQPISHWRYLKASAALAGQESPRGAATADDVAKGLVPLKYAHRGHKGKKNGARVSLFRSLVLALSSLSLSPARARALPLSMSLSFSLVPGKKAVLKLPLLGASAARRSTRVGDFFRIRFVWVFS